MTHTEILALTPGPDLDQAVHLFVFNQTGDAPRYSTDDAAGIKLLDRLPLFVARVDPSHPQLDPSRPWIAGTLAHEPAFKGDVTTLRVSAPTRLTALCKAALLVVLRPARVNTASPESSRTQAQDVAARIGTPAARNPRATVPTRGKPGPKPRGKAKIEPPAPQIRTRGANQPRVFVHGNEKLAPMPKRTKEFIAPQPLATIGGAQTKA